MAHQILLFVAMVFGKWQGYVTGGGVTALVVVFERLIGKTLSKKAFIIIFVLVFLLVSVFVAWREEYTSADWRGGEIYRLSGLLQGRDAQIQGLQSQLIQKDRPINIQVPTDPEIGRLLALQDDEISKLKGELPSPKKKALQLSNDLLTFLTERVKATPEEPLPHPGMTVEQISQQREEFERNYLQWMKNTGIESQSRFAVSIDGVFQDMKAEKIDTGDLFDFCSFFNGSTSALQRCATRIGYFAQKLSH